MGPVGFERRILAGIACAVVSTGCYGSTADCPDVEQGDTVDACGVGCADRECGPDPVCGFWCGECAPGKSCSADGRCVARCSQEYCDEVLVPEGQMITGLLISPDDSVRLQVMLSAFWIDRYEVTIERYRACVDAGACLPPDPDCTRPYLGDAGGDESSWWYDDPGFLSYSYDFEHRPMGCLYWDDMVQYCQWIGRRLPTVMEWRKAAFGGCEVGGDPDSCDVTEDLRPFPWGFDPIDCDRAMVGGCADQPLPDTPVWPVGSAPLGASPYGALDMAGNAGEALADWGAPSWETMLAGYGECETGCRDPAGPGTPEGYGDRAVVCPWGNLSVVDTDAYCYILGGAEPRDATVHPGDGPYAEVGFRCARSADGE
ncbi:MAG: SUMF1/EgtB/PvdO family nonheme iron enzyme [Deltaproteobacteria bacterium]|nr:SUMF1/EgtB/PvdO family nonheme iron enzyme [Deltaproteobacteria bacterium]